MRRRPRRTLRSLLWEVVDRLDQLDRALVARLDDHADRLDSIRQGIKRIKENQMAQQEQLLEGLDAENPAPQEPQG